MITTEEIYSEYRKQTIHTTKGIYPRNIVNWEKIKKKPNWIFYERCAQMINNSAGQINHKRYIKILAEHYNTIFDPKLLCSMKSIRIYRNNITISNLSNDIEEIYEQIKKSIKFITNYCIMNDINNVDEYILENRYTLPTLAKHYNSGDISEYFLNIIPDGILKSVYPPDIFEDFFGKYSDNYKRRYKILLKDQRIRKIMDFYPNIINKIIENKRNNINKKH